ncbi:hypothetical protein [Streptomyces sp. CNQ085]|nr:hypothetical protein [Streptomyces sp. CNQ085]
MLFAAFPDDLRHSAQRWFTAPSCLVLLDNCHAEQGVSSWIC